ncbi:MAG: hypothetical protein AAF493_11630 [Pseudomonadota bacterium]
MSASASIWLVNPSGQRASGEFVDDTLVLRAREQGQTRRLTSAGEFPRQRVEVVRADDGWEATNELYYRRGWTDGLPVVPPTIERVGAFVRKTGRGRDEVVAALEPLGGVATVEKIAANAVMAGCEASHMAVLLPAVEALAEPDFYLNGVQTTDENVAPLMVVNGPVRNTLEMNASFGALGPGWRGNAALGRALRLVMHNIGGGWPGAVSFAGLGQPARYTLCIAENEEESPWSALHVDHDFKPDESAVTLLRAESAINVTGGLHELASVMGSAASAFSILYGGHVGVIIAPFTAQQCAREGMSKTDVKAYLHEHGRWSEDEWKASWSHTVKSDFVWPEWVEAARGSGSIPVVGEPDDITIVVAGGNVPIAQQAYFPTWGFPPCRLMRGVEPV